MKRVQWFMHMWVNSKSKHVFNLMFHDERQIDALNDNASLGIGANAFSADIILN
jgi:hypothetical protein